MFYPANLNKIVLSLGSNLGNREKNLKKALQALKKLPLRIIKVSKIYESKPWGFKSPHLFLNLVLLGETSLSPWAFIFEIKKIEAKMGRKLKKKKFYEDRLIDIDIIFYENLVIKSKSLTIPHPHMHERDFVIIPSLEIIPFWIHPIFKKSVAELYKDLNLSENKS
ncbi:MAG: 2-amino-4-hydroxy-6-hydroxymethyldihydropteridine diphosphokinase [Thermodesulfobacterium geofontis]|uniref:2-amino-4-hydroxy-6-hydroxymethyldihydropteridine pyrophosphokinase n=1 Tax=Thermodesulfobacterium geofontis TaxID=1295609 RepID=A0A2N7PPN8_9BACT|nr:MAG: 2-amino-4-hydroxy-6-hydroxymethyldihydropteridine diphosphokinase [Thermodesulfobacterium geofontis]